MEQMDSLWPDTEHLLEHQNALAQQVAACILMQVEQDSASLHAVRTALLHFCATHVAGALGIVHPIVFQFYYSARDAGWAPAEVAAHLRGSVLPELCASQSRASASCSELSLPWDVGASWINARTHERLDAASANAAQRVAPVQTVARLTPEQWDVLKAALRILQQAWPEMHAELARNVQCLVPITGQAAIGAADMCCHGAVYMNLTRFVDPVKLAEELVHEASHVRLNTLMAGEDVVLNDPAERFTSPLRRDSRPMIGLVHQVFVLSRLLVLYERLSRIDESQRHHVPELQRLLQAGVAVVQEHGKLSNVGRQLLASMSAAVRVESAA